MAKFVDMTYQAELLEKPKSMRKDRIVLERLGLIIWPDGIRLDSLT